MDNGCYKNWIVRYTCKYADGSYRQFHVADYKRKYDAEKYIEKKNKTKLPNEEYTLIDNNY